MAKLKTKNTETNLFQYFIKKIKLQIETSRIRKNVDFPDIFTLRRGNIFEYKIKF